MEMPRIGLFDKDADVSQVGHYLIFIYSSRCRAAAWVLPAAAIKLTSFGDPAGVTRLRQVSISFSAHC